VERHLPENPQTTLKQFMEGGERSLGLYMSEFKRRLLRVGKVNGEVKFTDIAEGLKDRISDGRLRIYLVERVVEWLRERGIRVLE